MGERGEEVAGFPYRVPRPGQLEVARAVREAVEQGSVIAIRAPTGFGKTAAVLKGVLDSGAEKIVYVVRTRNEVYPVLRELRRFRLRDYVFLYSARRMCPLLEDEGLGIEDFWNTCRLLRLRGDCAYYSSLADVDEEEIRSVLVSSESPRKIISGLTSLGVCPFFALKLLVPSSRIIVATYPYLFKSDIFELVFEPYTLRDLVVVVDEAHSLLSLQSVFEARVTIRDIDSSIREIEEYGLPAGLAERLQELRRLVAGAKASEKLTRLSLDKIREILEEPGIWRDAAEEVRMEKTRERLENGAPVSLRVYLTRVAAFAEAAWRENVGAYIARNDYAVLRILPLEPCDIVGSVINSAKAAVLMSGTLPEATALKALMCIDKEIRYIDVEEKFGPVFPPENLAVIVTSELTSKYTMRSREMYKLYASYITETFRRIRKSMLVVYPSYDFMRKVSAFLEENNAAVIEGRETRVEDIVQRIREDRHLLINAVAGGKLAEGIELVDERGGSTISVVFIAGIPYPQPDDYVSDQIDALSRRIGTKQAKTLFFEVSAAMRVLQAVGRARRQPEDTALVVLGDYRFTRPSLARRLGALLRRYRRVSSLNDYRASVEEAVQGLDL